MEGGRFGCSIPPAAFRGMVSGGNHAVGRESIVKVRHGLATAGLTLAWLAGSALMPAAAGAEPRVAEMVPDQVPASMECTIDISGPEVTEDPQSPRVNDFVVHFGGVVNCDTTARGIDGWMTLRRDGNIVGDKSFHIDDAIGGGIRVDANCVSGAYQATMTAHWVPMSGPEGSTSAESPIVDVTC